MRAGADLEAERRRGDVATARAEVLSLAEQRRELDARLQVQAAEKAEAARLQAVEAQALVDLEAVLKEESELEQMAAAARRRVEALVAQGRMLQAESVDCERQAVELKQGLQGAGLLPDERGSNPKLTTKDPSLRQKLEEKRAEVVAADALISQLGQRLAEERIARQDGPAGVAIGAEALHQVDRASQAA